MTSSNISEEAVAAESGLFPDAQFIVDILASLKPIYECTAQEARLTRETKQNPFALDPANLSALEDIKIQTSNGQIPARKYQPVSDKASPLPGFVYFHGGGFVLGSIKTHDTIAQNLAAVTGCIVISVEYRLAPETRFPGAVQDAYDAFHWVYQQADNLGIDKDKLVIGGDSAGGNLAAVTCLRNRDQGGPQACFQVLIYPVTDMTSQTGSKQQFAQGPFLDQPTMKWFNGFYAADAESLDNPWLSPLKAENHADLPPAYIMTAGFDPLRDEGKAYADTLRAAGVQTTHTCYTDMFHGFLSFGKTLPQAMAVINQIGKLLKVL